MHLDVEVVSLFRTSSVTVVAWALVACSRGGVESLGVHDAGGSGLRADSDAGKASVLEQELALTAAGRLYSFLQDGEDGCTCGDDLKALVQAFQRAQNGASLTPRPGTIDASSSAAERVSKALPTHGYLDWETAQALAVYSGHWLPPCYGRRRRCGPVPGSGVVARAGRSSVASRTVGGCRTVFAGEPGRGGTCNEIMLTTGVSPDFLRRLQSDFRNQCQKKNPPGNSLMPDWVYDEDGCPAELRIAGCRTSDVTSPGAVNIQWFYQGGTSSDEARITCRQSAGTFVAP
jgi:hypothetical protein